MKTRALWSREPAGESAGEEERALDAPAGTWGGVAVGLQLPAADEEVERPAGSVRLQHVDVCKATDRGDLTKPGVGGLSPKKVRVA